MSATNPSLETRISSRVVPELATIEKYMSRFQLPNDADLDTIDQILPCMVYVS